MSRITTGRLFLTMMMERMSGLAPLILTPTWEKRFVNDGITSASSAPNFVTVGGPKTRQPNLSFEEPTS
jgi:hypothetical protein